MPAPVAGKYLWTRTVLTFNSGSPVTFYSVARYGIDGTGAVSSVNSVSPDGNGNVSLVANDIPTAGGTSVEADLSGVKNTLTQLDTATQKIIPIFSDSTNNLGYTLAAGSYFESGGNLYTASTAIPTGETWADKSTAVTANTAINLLKTMFSVSVYTLSEFIIASNSTGAYILTPPSGYIPIASYFEGTITGGNSQVSLTSPIKRGDNTTLVRFINHQALQQTLNGSLYVLYYKNA